MDVDVAGRRPMLTLDGLWDFEFEGPTAQLDGEGHTIRTPGIWQTQFPALRNAQGTGRYRRGVQIPADWAGKSIHLIMEGVFHESVILVDEVAVAVHGDGWTPIEIDLTASACRQDLVRARRRCAGPRRPQWRALQPIARRQAGLVRGSRRNLEVGAARGARPDPRRQSSRANIVRPQDGRCVGERRAIARAAATTLRATLSRGGEFVARTDLSFSIRADFDAELALPER